MSFLGKIFGGGGASDQQDRAIRMQQQQYEQSLAETRRHNAEAERLSKSSLELQQEQLKRVDEQQQMLKERDRATRAEESAKMQARLTRGGRRRDLAAASLLGTGEDDTLGGR